MTFEIAVCAVDFGLGIAALLVLGVGCSASSSPAEAESTCHVGGCIPVAPSNGACPATPFALAGPPVLTADFNGDGRTDIVVSPFQSMSRMYTVMLRNADGTFRSLPEDPLLTMADPIAGDFDGDGKQDLLLSQWDDSSHSGTSAQGNNFRLSVASGKGDGTFSAPVLAYGNDAWLSVFVIFDANGDHAEDIFVNQYPDTNLVLLGGKTIVPVESAGILRCNAQNCPGDAPMPPHPADFNGDGFADFVFFERDGFVVIWGSPSGVLTRGPMTFVPGTKQDEATPADFNRDGHQDLAITEDGAVWIYLGRGDGTFEPAREVSGAPYAVSSPLGVVDRDGDGAADLVFVAGDGTIEIRHGVGDGSFAAPTLIRFGVPYLSFVGALDQPASPAHDLLFSISDDRFATWSARVLSAGCQ